MSVRINLTNEEYELLVLMMGMHVGSMMKEDPKLAQKVVTLYVSIVGKREDFVSPEESKKIKTEPKARGKK